MIKLNLLWYRFFKWLADISMNIDTAKQMYLSLYKDIPGFNGVGVRENKLQVYIETEETKKSLPNTMGMYKVEFVVTGKISTSEPG